MTPPPFPGVVFVVGVPLAGWQLGWLVFLLSESNQGALATCMFNLII